MTADALAREVARIRLAGAPLAILVDVAAIGERGGQVDRLLDGLGLDVHHIDDHAPTLTGHSLAVFGSDHPPVAGCHAWYVGPGPTPEGMHPTAGDGPRTSAFLLSLLGTGFAQERAGAAFRAAGAGLPTPRSVRYDPAVLSGITAAVAPWTAGAASPGVPALDVPRREALLLRSAAALGRCCAGNGAIAAAPPSARAGEPDYWFFWQRDAAHAAVALHALTRTGPSSVRGACRERLDAYVGFVAELGPALARLPNGIAASRCTMDGQVVGRYGDPQHDGPAATALAVLSVVEDPRAALAVARPFLEHLLAPHEPGFDCWELTVGRTFHAANLARRALRRAAVVGAAVEDEAPARYDEAATRQALQLNDFCDPVHGGFVHCLRPQPAWFGTTSRLDMSVIGSALLAGGTQDDVAEAELDTTMSRLEQHFLNRWPVNAAWQEAGHLGGGIGRFPEDCNDGLGSTGGNPWLVTTLWAAQHHFRRAGRLVAEERTQAMATGLGYLSFVLAHGDRLSEQIDGRSGRPRGARSLAWAHAELVIALTDLARAEVSDGGPARPERSAG